MAEAYAESQKYFEDAPGFRVNDNGELMSDSGMMYVRTSKGANSADVEALESAEMDADTRVYGEDGAVEVFYEVTDEFIKYLAELETWRDLAGGRFEQGAKRAYQLKME